jgi:hypothetical protein
VTTNLIDYRVESQGFPPEEYFQRTLLYYPSSLIDGGMKPN